VLNGIVAPAVLSEPTIGVLLRLGIACSLHISLSAVQILSADSSNPGFPLVVLEAADPVNTAQGVCSDLSLSPHHSRRRLSANLSSAASLIVNISAVLCGHIVQTIASPLESSLLTSLANGSAALSFAPFLNMASAFDGDNVTLATVVIAGPFVAAPSQRVTASAAATGGDSTPSSMLVGVVIAVVLVLTAAFVLAALLDWRQRQAKMRAITKPAPRDASTLEGSFTASNVLLQTDVRTEDYPHRRPPSQEPISERREVLPSRARRAGRQSSVNGILHSQEQPRSSIDASSNLPALSMQNPLYHA
jgi:hypothetical protein